MNRITRNIIKNLAFLIIGVLLLWWAFHSMKIDDVMNSLRSAKYSWVLIAILCGVFAHWSRAMRWRQLISSIGYKTSMATAFNAVMIGYLFNFVVPRMGEVSRCAVINRKDRIPLDKLIGTVITERLFDLFVITVISLGIYMAQFNMINNFILNVLPAGPCVVQDEIATESGNSSGEYLLIGLGVLFVGFLAYLFIKNPSDLKGRIREFVYNAWDGIKSITKLKSPFWFVVHTLNIWLMYFLMGYFIFFSLPATAELGISAAFFVLLLGTMAIIVPIPGGIGTYHTFVAIGLTIFALDCNDGKLYATISHGAQMVMIFAVGGVSLLVTTWQQRRIKNPVPDEKQADKR